jgi:hypothetical protein
MEDPYKRDTLPTGVDPEGNSPGLQQFIDDNPGVKVGFGPGPFLVALYPSGEAVMLDSDGTVIDDPLT